MDYPAKIKLSKIMKILPTSNVEKKGDCAVCKSKIQSDGESWINLSTGIKATYWLAFCAVSVICVLFPNEKIDGMTFEEQLMSLQDRILHTNDWFRIPDDSRRADSSTRT